MSVLFNMELPCRSGARTIAHGMLAEEIGNIRKLRSIQIQIIEKARTVFGYFAERQADFP